MEEAARQGVLIEGAASQWRWFQSSEDPFRPDPQPVCFSPQEGDFREEKRPLRVLIPARRAVVLLQIKEHQPDPEQ